MSPRSCSLFAGTGLRPAGRAGFRPVPGRILRGKGGNVKTSRQMAPGRHGRLPATAGRSLRLISGGMAAALGGHAAGWCSHTRTGWRLLLPLLDGAGSSTFHDAASAAFSFALCSSCEIPFSHARSLPAGAGFPSREPVCPPDPGPAPRRTASPSFSAGWVADFC